jgi:hypothetical protein
MATYSLNCVNVFSTSCLVTTCSNVLTLYSNQCYNIADEIKKKILLVLKMHRKKVLLFWLADKNVIFTLCSLLSQKRMSLKRF